LPVVQNLVTIVGLNYDFDVEALAEETEPDVFCDEVALAANHLAENPPIDEVIEAAEDVRFTFESEFAFTYLDLAALEYMGIMPLGTEFRAWYRNFNESNMMFVSGLDFALFLDRRWTTMPVAVFESLPTLDGVKPLTFCDAFWCNGPGPTPTPTGQGPLEALVDASTPPPTLDLTGGSVGGKTQVSWNHIRVAYLLDKADTGTAQVTLEICREAAQIACEPVLRVFDGNTGTNKPVVSQFNGQNVYEFPYGYTSNLQIEGNTLISPDVWISDPTIR
jgi:hypothetical protein